MFKFKQIASVLAGTVLASSTLAIAAAANYPAPFVDGGSADVAIVYGSGTGAVNDLLAVLDINNDLSDTLARNTASGGSKNTARVTGDDIVQLDKSSDRLNYGEAIGGPFGTSVTDDDLPGLLADGQYVADDNDEFDYEQKITLNSIHNLTLFRDSGYESLIGADDRTPVVGFKIDNGDVVLNYTLDFTDEVTSDVVSGDLDDIEGSDLPLFGKTYYVSDWKNASSATALGKLTLLDSAATGNVKEGETVTVTSEGTTYEVSIDFVDSDSAKLSINGEVSDNLAIGATQKLSDGSYLGIRDVTKLEVSGEVGSVEFSIGSGKLELENGNDIKLNDDTITDVKSYLTRGSNDGVDKIIIEWVAEDEMFITSETEVTLPGFESLKFSMNELVRNDDEVITVDSDGAGSDASIELTVPIEKGTASINLLYTNASGEISGIGESSTERLATSSTNTLTYEEEKSSDDYHQYAVVTYNTSSDAESYLISLSISQDSTTKINETIVRSWEDGAWKDVATGKKNDDTVDLGSASFTLSSLTKSASAKSAVLTAGSNTNFNTLFTKGGLMIALPVEINGTFNGAINTSANSSESPGAGHDYDSFYLFMQGENKDDDKMSGTAFNFTIDDTSDDELHVTRVGNVATGGVSSQEIGSSDVHINYIEQAGTDEVAPRIEHTVPSSGTNTLKVLYPEGNSETYAEVFLSSTGAVKSSASGGSTGGSVVSLGNVYFTDDESSKFSGKNLVVVGGSCVNRLASDLLGGAGCGPSFTDATGVGSGQFLIETFSRDGGKVATLVAGYDMGDTRNAAKVLTTGSIDTGAGMKYRSTSATTVEAVTA